MAARNLRDRLALLAPRSLTVLAAEISGLCAVQEQPKANWSSRLAALVDRKNTPHPLFDPAYYLENNPAVKNPLFHFLLWGGFKGRQPHPLFDPAWYLEQNSDVVSRGLNPLQHYIRFGWREGRSPHPLFDVAWYLHTYPDVKAARQDPLLDFLERGGAEGRLPHPLFDTRWYLRRYPEAAQSGLNPLIHYLRYGGAGQLNPNRNFDAARYLREYPGSLPNPLIHYVTGAERGAYDPHPGYPRPAHVRQPRRSTRPPLTLASGKAGAPARWHNTFTGASLPIFVVYGSSNVPFLESQLLPALAAQSCRTRLHLHALNYRGSEALLSPSAQAFSGHALAGVTDWSSSRQDRQLGFGESVNHLFERAAPESCFLLLNPDAVPMPGCVDTLLNTFCERDGALVEARQWPSEHPKEYDPNTGWTPWASGACVLISSVAFRRLKGFDPVYFLYNEDVDLSWRAWLQDMPVLYEPAALCAHFTGMLSYRPSRYYYEHFFSIRNFLVIAYKFFGPAGESAALDWITEARLPAAFRATVEESYRQIRGDIQCADTPQAFHAGKLKILGLNLYHELRRV